MIRVENQFKLPDKNWSNLYPWTENHCCKSTFTHPSNTSLRNLVEVAPEISVLKQKKKSINLFVTCGLCVLQDLLEGEARTSESFYSKTEQGAGHCNGLWGNRGLRESDTEKMPKIWRLECQRFERAPNWQLPTDTGPLSSTDRSTCWTVSCAVSVMTADDSPTGANGGRYRPLDL